MCGICGKVSLDSQESVDEGLLRKMAGILRHRGPDDEGIYLSETPWGNHKIKVGLGHKRLSIIDLSSLAHQPMPNEDRTIWLVCNGEIYNFPELRKLLEEKGHRFISHSDSEVIIHLYEEFDIDCIKQLRGMFAFAIWDRNKQRLLLARDRIGKKPLNYVIKDGNLVFASEIKSILQDPDVSRQLNVRALHLYLTYQYVPAPETMFLGIKKLPSAHLLLWEKGEVRIERYWSLSFQNKLNLGIEDYCIRIRQLLSEATRIRMVSDVPLGAFLSGGIDSSAVVAMMSGLSRTPVKTFSIGFKEESFNELKYARCIASLFSTEHHEYIVEPECLEILPKLIWHYNEPFGDSSAIPTYYLCKVTRQEVTVALNGDGGDETFGGYQRYIANRAANIYSLIPLPIRKNIIGAFIKIFPESTKKKNFIRNFKRFTKGIDLPREKRYAFWMSIFDHELKNSLYTKELKDTLEGIDAWDYLLCAYAHSHTEDFIDATLFVDTMTYLPDDLLVKVDIASMANSLEVRSPFLDHKLMEFAASIPSGLKLKGITTKYILKKAFSNILPRQVLNRNKSGFGVPIGNWFRNELKDYVRQVLLSQGFIKRNYFEKETVKRILDEHASGKVDHGSRIWLLLNFELWHQMFIDHKSSTPI